VNAMRPASLRLPADTPPALWWVLLLPVLAAGLLVHWAAGVAVLALVIIQRARPLDFLTSYLMVVALGSFMNYGSGQLTYEMWILTAFLAFSLYCYALSRRWDALVIPRTPATTPLLLFFGLTLVNYIRGLMIGNSARYAGLELIGILAIVSCLLVSNRRLSEGQIRAAIVWLWMMGFGHFVLGAYVYSVIHARTIGVYFEPVPGVVSMILFNFALREPKRSRVLLWLLAMTPLLAHQFLSFTRGFWFAIVAGVVFSVAIYVGRGVGVRARARRATLALAVLAGVAAIGVIGIGLGLGIGKIWELAGSRVASSTGTKYTFESTSNVVRLVEYFHVLDLIVEQPIFGHGLGYSFLVREPMFFKLLEQWFTHNNYLLVTLKQGLIGLVLWVWMLIGFLRVGLNGRNLPNLAEQSWCVGAAAVVVYCMVYSLVMFPLAEVNTNFTFALAVGAAMRMTATDTIALRWKGRRSLPETM